MPTASLRHYPTEMVLGRLLISVPPHQTTSELAESLLASKGSTSAMTGLLIQIGLIERMSLPGGRRDYFRHKPNAWSQMTKQGFVCTNHRDQGGRNSQVGTNWGRDPDLGARLEELSDPGAFYEGRLPRLLEHREEQRKKRKENRR